MHGIASSKSCYCAAVRACLYTEQFCLQQLVDTNPSLAGLFHQGLWFWLIALSSLLLCMQFTAHWLLLLGSGKNSYLRRSHILLNLEVSKCIFFFSFKQSGEIQNSWEKLKQLQEWISVPLKMMGKEGKRKGRGKNTPIWQTWSSRPTLLVHGLRRKSSISKIFTFSNVC